MKYWNRARIQRVRGRQRRREDRVLEKHREAERIKRTHTTGEDRKNVRLMLNALASSLHRRMLSRLRKGGAMSVTHLSEPFRIMLPDAMRHVAILERAGLIVTDKRGRIRFCIYNPEAPRELSMWLQKYDPFDLY